MLICPMTADEIIIFEDFELDPARAELRRAGAVVALEPQVLDLIAYLASRPGQIVSRDDLIDGVWSGRIVSDSAIASRINAARAALGDDGSAQRLIKTVPRRGYRFEAETAAASPARPALPDKPSVAVLPFRNMSGDPEQAYFSDGITDDIITDLSRYDELFVIARHSSFAYRDSARPMAEIARDLVVQYIADGSVRRSGNRIRVTAQLMDPWAQQQLWAERYDRELTDIFEVQDEIASMIVNTMSGQITRQHYKRSLSKTAETVSAYDHVLRAMELSWAINEQKNGVARREAALALDLDPQNARARAVTAWTYIAEASNAWGDPVAAFDKAREHALAGVAADDREPSAHAVLGWVHQWRDRAHDRALRELGRALELNPASAYYRSLRAFSMTYAGQSEQALRELDIAMRLNPHHPPLYTFFYARALFNLHRYPEALPHLQRARTEMPGHANALALVAANYAALGRLDEAHEVVADVLAASPDYSIAHVRDVLPFALDEERDHLAQMLVKAGMPGAAP